MLNWASWKPDWASLSVLGARLGDVPMRFYKVFDGKTGPRGLNANNHYFPNRISKNFVFPRRSQMLPGHTESFLGTQNCSLGTQNCFLATQHGVLEARPGVLETELGGLGRLLRAFKWSWALPERSGNVPRSPRARINDFSLVSKVLGG